MTYAVFVEGIKSLQDFPKELESTIETSALRAVNKIAPQARTRAAKEIRAQVNFPSNYLDPSGGRLILDKRAKPGDLEAVIRGRQRATSLARFVTGSPQAGKRGGVFLQVSPGRARFMKRAFLVPLPAGSTLIDTQRNLGLAIRLRPGEELKNKKDARRLASNLYLLYGPSVDQVFRTVAADIADDTAADLETEFLRLMDLRL